MSDNPNIPLWDNSIDTQENYLRSKIPTEQWVTRSGADLLDDLRGIGFSISTQEFYSIRRDILNIAKHEEQIASLDFDTPVPLSYMDNVPTWNLKEKYQYQIRYSYTEGDDPTVKEGWYTVTSDKRLSKSEIDLLDDDILTETALKSDDKQINVVDSSLAHVYYKGA